MCVFILFLFLKVLLYNTTPQKLFNTAVLTARKCLGVGIGPFDVMQVTNGEDDAIIQVFLQRLKDCKQAPPHKNGAMPRKSSDMTSPNGLPLSHGDKNDPTWFIGSNETLTEEHRKMHSMPTQYPNHSQALSQTQMFDQQTEDRGSQQLRPMRVSYSTDHLNTYSNSYQSSPFFGSDLKLADGRTGRRVRQRPSSVEEHVSMLESANRGAYHRQSDMQPVHRSSLAASSNSSIGPPAYLLPKPSERGVVGVERSSSNSRYTLPASNTTVEYSYSNDIPVPVTIYRTSSRTSIHSTSSRSSVERNSLDDQQHITLANLSSPHSSIPPHMLPPPEYQTEMSLRDTFGRNTAGGSGFGNTVPLLGQGSMDQLAQAVDILDERVIEMAELMVEERNVLLRKMIKRGEYVFLY